MASPRDIVADCQHRVANDLSLLVGSLERGRRPGGTRPCDDVVEGAVCAILALAALYRQMYSCGEADAPTDLARYLQALGTSLGTAYLDRLRIRLDYRVEAVLVSADEARDVGMIVAELICNAAKHAFGANGGRIFLTMQSRRDELVVGVADDGRGLATPTGERSFSGLGGAARLAAGLGARLDFGTGPDGGLEVLLTVPRPLVAS